VAEQVSEPFDEEPPNRLRPFDWPWEVGEIIWPCRNCAVWWAELFLEGPHDAIWVREWHADCCAICAETEQSTD